LPATKTKQQILLNIYTLE